MCVIFDHIFYLFFIFLKFYIKIDQTKHIFNIFLKQKTKFRAILQEEIDFKERKREREFILLCFTSWSREKNREKEKGFKRGFQAYFSAPKQESTQSIQEAFNSSSPTLQLLIQVSNHLEKIEKSLLFFE